MRVKIYRVEKYRLLRPFRHWTLIDIHIQIYNISILWIIHLSNS